MPIQRITSRIIQDGAIVATEIADGSVTGPKLGATAINANNIVNGTITTAKINSSVTDLINTSSSTATSAGSYANAAFTAANTSSSVATSAGVYANGAFAAANTKQDALVSGTNIKTINGSSLLGSGDVTSGNMSVDTNTSVTATSYPIGQYLLSSYGNIPSQILVNASVGAPVIANDTNSKFALGVNIGAFGQSGTSLTGTWRSKGMATFDGVSVSVPFGTNNILLVQRTA